MKPRPSQFGVRENTASSRQHASRLAAHTIRARSTGPSAAPQDGMSFLSASPEESSFNSPNDTAHNVATAGEERHENHLLTVHDVADCCRCQYLGSTDASESDPWNDYQVTGLESIGVFVRTKCWRGSIPNEETRMLLDARGTLRSDIGKGGRANHSKERKRMARCRYQDGCLFIRGKRRKVWVARWREDVILADGSTSG